MINRNLGYPYFYGNDIPVLLDLNQEEQNIRFSLHPIREKLKLKIMKATTLTLINDPRTLGLGDEFTYQLCDQISQFCGTVHVMPQTQTVMLDYDGFCHFVSNSDIVIENISSNLEISAESVVAQAQTFFQEKNIIVQARGVQGTIYKVGSYLQSAGSAGMVANTLALAKLAGVNGVQILKAQPYLIVAIPTTGAMFFYGCGAIAGNSTFGKACITTGDALALPMKGVEMMWNSYGNPIIQKVFGIPVILNMTQTFKTGPGYTIQEVAQYISINNKSLVKSIKDKIINWLS